MKLLMVDQAGNNSVLEAKDERELKSKFYDELCDVADGDCQLFRHRQVDGVEYFDVAEVEIIPAEEDDPDSEEEVRIEWQLIS